MTGKRINYICCLCGAQERHRCSLGEPSTAGCPKNADNDIHLWIDSLRLALPIREKIKKQRESLDAKDFYYIGSCYLEGTPSLEYVERAVSCFEKSAEYGSRYAMNMLALMYNDSEYGIQDKTRAVHWFRKAADKGDCSSMFAMSVAYEYGEGVGKNLDDELLWYRKTAENATERPSFDIGGCDVFGFWDGTIEDVWNSNGWVNPDTSNGMELIGYAYEQGEAGVGKDIKEAVAWYRKASESGSTYAMFALGNMYENGKGVLQDKRMALDYYRKSVLKVFGINPNEMKPEEQIRQVFNYPGNYKGAMSGFMGDFRSLIGDFADENLIRGRYANRK